jgi:hypothetical protein
VSRQWCWWHLLYTRNSYNSATHTTEVGIASGISLLEHVHDGADEAVAVLDKLAFAGEVQGLEEETEASLHKYLIAVETEGEAELALI